MYYGVRVKQLREHPIKRMLYRSPNISNFSPEQIGQAISELNSIGIHLTGFQGDVKSDAESLKLYQDLFKTTRAYVYCLKPLQSDFITFVLELRDLNTHFWRNATAQSDIYTWKGENIYLTDLSGSDRHEWSKMPSTRFHRRYVSNQLEPYYSMSDEGLQTLIYTVHYREN